MKMVYTLWTRPGPFNRDAAIRWALSTHLVKKHGYRCELVTDSHGKNIVEKLGLGFEKIDTTLDEFLSVSPTYWAAGKIISYSMQSEPFCHIDDDVFLFKPLPEEFLNSSLFVQSPERSKDRRQDYKSCRDAHDDSDCEKVMLPFENWDCYNAGLIGGSDLEFIHDYANKSLDWMREMTAKNKVVRSGMVLAEQTLFAKMAKEQNKEITCLLDNHDNDELTAELGYTHLVNAKTWPSMKKRVMRRLKSEAPSLWNNIKNYYASSI